MLSSTRTHAQTGTLITPRLVRVERLVLARGRIPHHARLGLRLLGEGRPSKALVLFGLASLPLRFGLLCEADLVLAAQHVAGPLQLRVDGLELNEFGFQRVAKGQILRVVRQCLFQPGQVAGGFERQRPPFVGESVQDAALLLEVAPVQAVLLDGLLEFVADEIGEVVRRGLLVFEGVLNARDGLLRQFVLLLVFLQLVPDVEQVGGGQHAATAAAVRLVRGGAAASAFIGGSLSKTAAAAAHASTAAIVVGAVLDGSGVNVDFNIERLAFRILPKEIVIVVVIVIVTHVILLSGWIVSFQNVHDIVVTGGGVIFFLLVLCRGSFFGLFGR